MLFRSNEYLFQFSYTLGNIISPRLVERYSERENIEDLRRMVEVPMIVISRVAPAALGGVFFASEAIVLTMLPRFEPGLLPLQILLIGTFFSSVPRGLSSFFITVRRQSQTVGLYLAAIALNATLVWRLISMGHGLPGAAAGTTTSLAFFGFGLIILALRYFMTPGQIVRFLLGLIWPLLLGLSLVWLGHALSDALAGAEPSMMRRVGSLAAGAVLFLAAYSPVLVSLYRSHRSDLRPPPEPSEI